MKKSLFLTSRPITGRIFGTKFVLPLFFRTSTVVSLVFYVMVLKLRSELDTRAKISNKNSLIDDKILLRKKQKKSINI